MRRWPSVALWRIAGAYLSTAQNASFVREMTAGQGYIALAALIFGKWRPLPAMLACLMFGFLDAVAIRLQGVELPYIGEVPVQAIQALPYVLTVILLAGFIGKAIAPKAIGVPFVKERDLHRCRHTHSGICPTRYDARAGTPEGRQADGD